VTKKKAAALDRARSFGVEVAYEEFTSMLNPKYRGHAFQWAGFVAWSGRRAEVSCWQAFSEAEWKSWKDELKQAAREAAEARAQAIVEKSGILEWWQDNKEGT
jgi:hypothetical protein